VITAASAEDGTKVLRGLQHASVARLVAPHLATQMLLNYYALL
jgi:hypothetical protein